MTTLFGALEVYAHDHDLQYPENPEALVPDYLERLPSDPKNGERLVYRKTENGFLLEAAADYTSDGAETKGFPKMNQDGFFVWKEEDFPTVDDTELKELENS